MLFWIKILNGPNKRIKVCIWCALLSLPSCSHTLLLVTGGLSCHLLKAAAFSLLNLVSWCGSENQIWRTATHLCPHQLTAILECQLTLFFHPGRVEFYTSMPEIWKPRFGRIKKPGHIISVDLCACMDSCSPACPSPPGLHFFCTYLIVRCCVSLTSSEVNILFGH
jgi:hypothetical protein